MQQLSDFTVSGDRLFVCVRAGGGFCCTSLSFCTLFMFTFHNSYSIRFHNKYKIFREADKQ